MITLLILSSLFALFSGGKKALKIKLPSDNLIMINKLHPKIRPFAVNFLIAAAKAGYDLRITFAFRTFAEQDAIYSQGRKPLTEVNVLRKKAGLYLISQKENTIVSDAKAGRSLHNYGLAFDIVDRKKGYNIDYTKLRNIAYSVGLEIGPQTDYPHFQKTFGYTLDKLFEMLKNNTLNKL